MTETISEVITDIVKIYLQNERTTIVSSADAATLAARDLVEALQNPTTNEPFENINDTHHAEFKITEELFNIIPRSAEQQSINRHNERHWERQDVAAEPEKVNAPVTHL